MIDKHKRWLGWPSMALGYLGLLLPTLGVSLDIQTLAGLPPALQSSKESLRPSHRGLCGSARLWPNPALPGALGPFGYLVPCSQASAAGGAQQPPGEHSSRQGRTLHLSTLLWEARCTWSTRCAGLSTWNWPSRPVLTNTWTDDKWPGTTSTMWSPWLLRAEA